MRIMGVEWIKSKNPYQGLFNELKEGYGISPIEEKALVKQIEQFKEQMSNGTKDNNQIIRQVVAKGEPAGKRIRDYKIVVVLLTMGFNGREKIEKDNYLTLIN